MEIAQIAYEKILEIPRDKDRNPLTLEGAIRSMILKNPDMIQWRDDALDMMYCTLGAGIGWNKAGRLGDLSPNNYMNPPPQAGGQGVWSRDFGLADTLDTLGCSDTIRRRLQQQHDEQMAEAVDVVLNIDTRCEKYRPKRTRWYPISWYSPNLAAPENAQEDFFLGAIETATLISLFDPDWDMDVHWRNSIRAKEVASDILVILKDRQGG